MALQRLLGTMLASRLAGRGGMGGALGSAAMLGLARPLLRSKAGLAVMGYLAYRSYRSSQGQASPGAGTTAPEAGAARGSAGGIGGTIGSLIDQFAGGQRQPGQTTLGERIAAAIDGQAPAPAPEETMSDERALLLVRAMIAAAYSDGSLSVAERQRICDKLAEAGVEGEDRRLVERELDDPKPLDALLREVRDQETAQQFYLASRAAIDGATPAQQAYLAYLRQRLNLPEEDVRAADELAG
jgi:uncharacterized membrane protein YebE (DUF533 family)